ncbi:hypothetical protein PIB30_044339 [Stylosanthes scabra]|uniref:Uncharacterized protein n=1 Tax=Stylosanthes scabra TaxID=79078 RepID=A0ABU6QFE3_9FABA|nr:hypothetical protein [Stylosanthes scabra]
MGFQNSHGYASQAQSTNYYNPSFQHGRSEEEGAEKEAPHAKRSYASMVRGPDFVFEADTEANEEEEEDLMIDIDESETESDFDYTKDEGEAPSDARRKDKRTVPRRKIEWDDEGCPNLVINSAEQARLNKYWKHTLIQGC